MRYLRRRGENIVSLALAVSEPAGSGLAGHTLVLAGLLLLRDG